jgi:hypothetical protein
MAAVLAFVGTLSILRKERGRSIVRFTFHVLVKNLAPVCLLSTLTLVLACGAVPACFAQEGIPAIAADPAVGFPAPQQVSPVTAEQFRQLMYQHFLMGDTTKVEVNPMTGQTTRMGGRLIGEGPIDPRTKTTTLTQIDETTTPQ